MSKAAIADLVGSLRSHLRVTDHESARTAAALMLLWRLSSARRATDFDGGFGIFNDGRWNTRGRPVTYCATVPSLAALEKRVHVADPALLPPQVMVAYYLPDGISVR